MDQHLLSIVLFAPLAGLAVLLLIPGSQKNLIKVWANVASFACFLVSLPLVSRFDRNVAGFQFQESFDWIPAIGAKYLVGIDGISLLLVMLTTLVGFVAILSSWHAINDRVKGYYAMFLLLQTGMVGVFISLDFFLFYVFWELVLVPMYFIIGVWGGPRKLYAAIKFFLYTLAGSVLMLLGILTLYFQYHAQFNKYTFQIADLMQLDHAAGFAAVGVLGLLHRFRDQSAHVPVPHLAAGCARGGAHGGLRHPGQRAPEDGNLRIHPLLAAARPESVGQRDHRADSGGAFHRRHRLRRAGELDAAGLEKADRLFFGEPSGFLHAGHLRHESQRHRRQRDPADQPRHLDRHAVLDYRRDLRAAAHA